MYALYNPHMQKGNSMRIQEISRKTGISKRNIHYYIEERLLSPRTNPRNGYYEFDEDDYYRLQFIVTFRAAGMPVAAIRSLLNNPLTAGYYLNLHAQRLFCESNRLAQTFDGINYILEHLSLSPDITELYELSQKSGLSLIAPEITDGEINTYNIALVNRFLWGGFFSSNNLTEYQEFLWAKPNRKTMQYSDDNYKKLGDFLQTLDSAGIDKMYSCHYKRYEYIASLESDSYAIAANSMIEDLKNCLNDKRCVEVWKKYYTAYFYPLVSAHGSDLVQIVMEMSNLFTAYSTNACAICSIVYEWLNSDEGKYLRLQLYETFPHTLDLEHSNHGELEALVDLMDIRYLFPV